MLGWPLARLHNFYLLKVNNGNIRTRGEICSKLTIKQQNDATGIVLVFLLLTLNIFHTLLVFLLSTLNIVIAGWVKVIGPVT